MIDYEEFFHIVKTHNKQHIKSHIAEWKYMYDEMTPAMAAASLHLSLALIKESKAFSISQVMECLDLAVTEFSKGNTS